MDRIPLQHRVIHGHKVGYRLAGQGPAILLIHGMAGSSSTWRDVMPELAKTHTVIAPDLLGHGNSAKPMGDYSLGAHATGIRDLLISLEIDEVTVVGQSLGGGVAMQFAYQHPGFANRLVLIGSGGLGRGVNPLLRLFTLPGVEYLMPIIFPSFVRRKGDEIGRWVKAKGWSNPTVSEMWRAYASLSEPENRPAFVRTLRAVIDPGGQSVSAMDRLYLTAALPTMIVWGDRDPIIPVQHAYDAHEAMPGSVLHVFEGVGHFPHVECPARVIDALRDFLSSTEAHQLSRDDFHAVLRAKVS
jgi:pimeloyl-ACP methyl ester carboxylesterase